MRLLALLPLFLSLSGSSVALPTGPRGTSSGNIVTVNTQFGQAKGVAVGDGSVVRFVAKYATAARFGNPVPATKWIGLSDPTALPPTCPQTMVDPSGYSEDCLYVVAYVHRSLLDSYEKTAPTYFWIHGGSFLTGQATQPGLDGTKLVQRTKGIVVYIQYRIGVLGFLPPSTAGSTAGGNLGVKDAITALKFVNQITSAFGGNNEVTIGGQSAGATMIRALISSPQTTGLYRAATLHGDPMTYGWLKYSAYQALQTAFYSNASVANPTTIPVATLLNAQDYFINSNEVLAVDPSVGPGLSLRPHIDNITVKYSLTHDYPPSKKPLLITTNRNEAGQATGSYYPTPMNVSEWAPTAVGWLGEDRGTKIVDSKWYTPNATVVPSYAANGDETRQAVERMLTDYLWRCPNWDLAKRWTKAGGVAYTGIFEAGVTYPDNADNSYCTENGNVCHEDEKYVIFESAPNPTPSQTALSEEFEARLAKFILNPSQGPNPSPYPHWGVSSSSDAKVRELGGPSNGTHAPLYACDPSFWGSQVLFNWQLYGE